MLFNSYSFILLFLPVTWIGFHGLSYLDKKNISFIWLAVSSIIFYGYWSSSYVWLILSSIFFNYFLSGVIAKYKKQESKNNKIFLIIGIVFNLSLLGYFKYTNFFIANISAFTETNITTNIILPIGISFFTFQQVAYLTDTYRGIVVERGFFQYCLFVSFFPQLIAGPIVHHQEMMPQFKRGKREALTYDLAIGITIFTIGLAKKVIIADTLAQGATPVFDAAAAGTVPDFFSAWRATLCYSFQIYFDFSGYSDMAIGLARLFGIRLPMNFASPYKARSLIDFWQRWHITLSRFLRDYLYFPIGGGRKGRGRRYLNIFVVMLLGGIWHGAGWTFALWGGIHGLLIVVNHAWRTLRKHMPLPPRATPLHLWRLRLITFFCVTLAWVPFRATAIDAVVLIYKGMFGGNGLGFAPFVLADLTSQTTLFVPLLLVCFWITWFLPNTAEFMRKYNPIIPSKGYPTTNIENIENRSFFLWRPSIKASILVSIIFYITMMFLSQPTEFLYFQF